MPPALTATEPTIAAIAGIFASLVRVKTPLFKIAP